MRIEALQFFKTFSPILIREPVFSFLPFAIEVHFLLVGTQQFTQKPHVWCSINPDEVIPEIEYCLEQFSLRWEAIDLELGLITLRNTKAALNEEARTILRRLQIAQMESGGCGAWVFPSEQRETHVNVTNSTIGSGCQQ